MSSFTVFGGPGESIDSRIWVNFTRNGLRLGSRHQEPPHTDVHFMLPSADQLFKDADFIFQQDLAPAHTAKSTKSWLNDHAVGVLEWPANSPDLNPRESMRYCQEENEKQETKKCR